MIVLKRNRWNRFKNEKLAHKSLKNLLKTIALKKKNLYQERVLKSKTTRTLKRQRTTFSQKFKKKEEQLERRTRKKTSFPLKKKKEKS